MSKAAPFTQVAKVAKKHPVATAAVVGIALLLVILRARSGSSGSGFDEEGPDVGSGGGGGGGGSVPVELVPGAPTTVPNTPTAPSPVLSSPIVSIPSMPGVDWGGGGGNIISTPAYIPAPVSNLFPESVTPLREAAAKTTQFVAPTPGVSYPIKVISPKAEPVVPSVNIGNSKGSVNIGAPPAPKTGAYVPPAQTYVAPTVGAVSGAKAGVSAAPVKAQTNSVNIGNSKGSVNIGAAPAPKTGAYVAPKSTVQLASETIAKPKVTASTTKKAVIK